MNSLEYGEMLQGQEQLVSALVWEVFREYVAPGYSMEGIESFKRFVMAGSLRQSVESGRFFIICCRKDGDLAGVISVRDLSHISLLFVKKDCQGMGIAKELFKRALKKIEETAPDICEITVNSSPYAVDIYKRLGFKTAGEPTTRDGITFIPMTMPLAAALTYREMHIVDYDEIFKLWSSTPGMGLSNADTYENINKFLLLNKGLSFVCMNEDKIIGTVLCGNDGRRGYIYHATVEEGFRLRGIGRALVEKSLERLRAEGIDKCHLFVFAENDIGNTFWRASGWSRREDIFVYSKST